MRERMRDWLKRSVVLLGLAVVLGGVRAVEAQPADDAVFMEDLRALTAGPHRLIGTAEGRAAGDYIKGRLEAALGSSGRVLVQDVPAWQVVVDEAELRVGGRVVAVQPMRPNLVVPVSTPAEGLRGPVIYAGDGTLQAYGDRDPEGAIVVLDFGSGDAWERAFALGAKAVVFLRDEAAGEVLAEEATHAQLPVNLVRVSVDAGESGGVDLRADHAMGTLVVASRWERVVGRNIVGFVPGTAPVMDEERGRPEVVVLGAAYDSYGRVPTRSPGARGAANVAGLLAAAERFAADPPKRDTAVVFFDGRAQAHVGARQFYDAFMMSPARDTALRSQHAAERENLERMRRLLGIGLAELEAAQVEDPDKAAKGYLLEELKRTAEWRVAELKRRKADLLVSISVGQQELSDAEKAARETEVDGVLQPLLNVWDDGLRGAMHYGELGVLMGEVEAGGGGYLDGSEAMTKPEGGDRAERLERFGVALRELGSVTAARFEARLSELDLMQQLDDQRAELRGVMRAGEGDEDLPKWVAVHVDFNLGDATDRFGVVAGGDTHTTLGRQPDQRQQGDNPGLYNRLLSALLSVAEPMGLERLDLATLGDASRGARWVPVRYVVSGDVAGMFGVHNVAVMTGYDAMVREGQPGDTVGALDAGRVWGQAWEAAALLRAVADEPRAAPGRDFRAKVVSKDAGWSGGKATGSYTALRVMGGLAENRPASGSVVAVWPAAGAGSGPPSWAHLLQNDLPGYDGVALASSNTEGRYALTAMHQDLMKAVATVAAQFDGRGELVAMSTLENMAQDFNTAMRVDLAKGRSYYVASIPTYPGRITQLTVLQASSETAYRNNLVLTGQLGFLTSFFVADQVIDRMVKVFQPMGPVVLDTLTGAGVSRERSATGFELSRFEGSTGWLSQMARDLHALNEIRLKTLRDRGVSSASLERLHGAAESRLAASSDGATLAERTAAALQSAAISHRVYPELRSTMDDLVRAVVVLLLLAIPFAFAMERLLVCATSIYGRIAGFTVLFLVTFGLLYLMHPGFQIASTPIIIFLAFAILLLSGLVIYIVVRKFQSELKVLQGRGMMVHEQEGSQVGTMLAAVGMGMSTMRRRPTRTTLTAVTVVMLTFTILSFASFSVDVGVRETNQGPVVASMPEAVLVRNLDYSALEPGVLDLVYGLVPEGDGLLSPTYWLVGKNPQQQAEFPVSAGGAAEQVNAVKGVDPAALERWPALAAALGAEGADGDVGVLVEQLRSGGVLLPLEVATQLGLEPEDEVLVAGRSASYIGPIRERALQLLREVDEGSVLPVDFTQSSAEEQAGGGGGDDESLLVSEVQKDYVFLSPAAVAIAGNGWVREAGGELHTVSVYPADGQDPLEVGREVAKMLVMPAWAPAPDGVRRMLLTRLTSVSGGVQLLVPLLLGGLIIFGTLLGSIQDREKEIYTFSALGLSPFHVGLLFFAEATVYAVVGGMGGQLLAQGVAQVAAVLASAGLIDPVSINYSSTNSLFAIGVVMLTVIVSAIYPALRASKSANPGLARTWQLPKPEGDVLNLTFPFTVSAYDMTGVASFLAEHFERHDDPGLGAFAASSVEVFRDDEDRLGVTGEFALSPFDLGVTQTMRLTAIPSEIPGVDEVSITCERLSGSAGDWYRTNKTFMKDLRKQFLLWRTLPHETIEGYRLQTLQKLGGGGTAAAPKTGGDTGGDTGPADPPAGMMPSPA
ncbi:MAG: FtsX-like permease family protein [Planctomycetota bacterium]